MTPFLPDDYARCVGHCPDLEDDESCYPDCVDCLRRIAPCHSPFRCVFTDPPEPGKSGLCPLYIGGNNE